MNILRAQVPNILVVVAFCLLALLSLTNLTESPQTWMDEGAIDQVAMNLAKNGIYGYQIAPGRFISAEFLTTGYPVVYPVAISFLLLGTNLLAARLIMVLFILLLGVSVYWYVKLLAPNEQSHYILPVLSLFLLVSFAPLYGHGKNVLGEVPGLVFFVLSLLSLLIFERWNRAWWLPLMTGVLSGLAMATKPLYLILILPSYLCVVLLLKRKSFSFREKGLFVLGMLVPLILWVIAQSGDSSVLHIFSYGNPNNTPLTSLITKNSMRFFSEFQPIYFLGLVILWWVGVALRKREGIQIRSAELIAIVFSLLNIISFVTTRGFYRYFFPSQVLALLFLPYALYSCMRLWLSHTRSLRFSALALIALIGLQSYQLFFHSWVSDSQKSVRSSVLTRELGKIAPEQSVFFYHVPEAVLFLPHDNYYQYLKFADTVERGDELFPLLLTGVPSLLLVDARFSTSSALLNRYKEKSHFDKYTLYEKK